MPARNHITPAEYHALHRLKSDYSVTELAGMFGRTAVFVQRYLDPYTKKKWRYCSLSELKAIVIALEDAKNMTEFLNAVQFVGIPFQGIVTLWKHRYAYIDMFKVEIDRFGTYDARVIKLLAEAEAKRSPPPTPEPAPEPTGVPDGAVPDNDIVDLLAELVEEVRGLSYSLHKLNVTQEATLALFQELQNKGKGNGNGKQTTLRSAEVEA